MLINSIRKIGVIGFLFSLILSENIFVGEYNMLKYTLYIYILYIMYMCV